jgi:hypothetical protein
VGSVGRQESIPFRKGELVGSLERRQGCRAVAARASEPSSLDHDPALGPADLFGFCEEAITTGKSATQSLDSRELGQDGRPIGRYRFGCEQRPELLFARLQIVEIPDVTPTVQRRCH